MKEGRTLAWALAAARHARTALERRMDMVGVVVGGGGESVRRRAKATEPLVWCLAT